MFFDFFRKKSKEIEEIKFSELSRWLDESSVIKTINEEFKSKVTEYFSQLTENLNRVEDALKVLKAVTLEHRKFDSKVKEIVLQNKEVYAAHVSYLVAGIKKEIEKKPCSLDEIENFVSATVEMLDAFSKQSFKSFHITSELIGHELEMVVECISAISNCIEKIKTIDKEKAKALMFIKECIKNVEEKENALNEIETRIAELQKEKQKIEKKIAEAEKENEEIKNSEEWKKKQELSSKLESLNCELNTNSFAVKSLFLSIEKAFKKWAWKNKNNKVLEYLKNPLEALKKDNSFEIMNVLTSIKQDIIQDKLELDEKRKEQFQSAISSITKESLAAFIEKENQILNEINKCRQELSKYNIEFIDIARISSQKNDILLEIMKLEKRKQNFERAILEKKKEIENVLKTISSAKLVE